MQNEGVIVHLLTIIKTNEAIDLSMLRLQALVEAMRVRHKTDVKLWGIGVWKRMGRILWPVTKLPPFSSFISCSSSSNQQKGGSLEIHK